MGLGEAWDYYLSMGMIECREDLLATNVSGFPHKKQAKQREYTTKLNQGMQRYLEKETKEMTTEDIYFDLIRKLGNGG